MATALGDENVSRVLIVTAWVRESGLRLLVPGLEAVRERGGTTCLLFGVDLRGTSYQGVDLAREHFDQVHAVHDPSGGTFHPKMYLALGDRVGYALVGSNNPPAGGLWHNYEAGVTVIFDPRREVEILNGIESYADRLFADKAICKRVTQPVYDRLLADGWLGDETTDRRRNEDRPGPTSAPKPNPGPPLFTPSQAEKRGRPVPIPPRPTRRRVSTRARRQLAVAPDSWTKQIGAGDAQHPLVGNPTGNVALTDIPEGYDRATFFRKIFFGAERWRRVEETGKRTELATVAADIEIGADWLGRYDLTVVYRPYRSTRGRATTVLRWEAVLPELRARDVTDWYLLIERGDVGAYRVRLTPTAPV